MSYQVLARKWRPKQFSQVVGQQHIVAALAHALDADRVHHAFLFTGTRGVGKTTLARIFAKALNCEAGMSANPCGECSACRSVVEGNYIDLIEVDAASRTKVDDTRDLLDNVQYAPAQGRYKVYLIDEVHMLSTHSFNALLKTLEEPPAHVKFLLATTDPQKLPMTILSRCIQFSLNAIEQDAISTQLATILEAEQISYETQALQLIARAASGSMRDALSLLDQAIAFGNANVSAAALRSMLGMVDSQQVGNIVAALAQQDYAATAQVVDKMMQKSVNFATAMDDLLSILHAISAYQFAPNSIAWKGFDSDEIAAYAKQFTAEQLQLYYQIMLHGKRDLHLAPDLRTGFEMAMLRLFAFSPKAKPATAAMAPARAMTAAPAARVAANGGDSNAIAAKHADSKATNSHSAGSHSTGGHATNSAVDTRANLAESAPPSPPLFPSSPSLGAPVAPPVASTRAQTPPASPIAIAAAMRDINLWGELINSLSLQGMTQQLALYMSPQSFADSIVSVNIDPLYKQFLNKDRLSAIEKQINDRCLETVKLQAQLAAVDAACTATAYNAQRVAQNTEETRQSFQEDPSVQEMVALFDATVDVNSIKPT